MTPDDQTTEKMLIDGIPDMSALPEREIRRLASEDISARPTLATARDIAGRIYFEPDKAVDQMVARYQIKDDREALVSEVERTPGSFGELRGTTRIGIANAARMSALEQAPMMAGQMEKHLGAVVSMYNNTRTLRCRVDQHSDSESYGTQTSLRSVSLMRL